MHNHTCLTCNSVFESKSSRSIYCSKQCNWRMQARRHYERNKEAHNRKSAERKRKLSKHKWTFHCIHCGVKIEHPNAVRKYCSSECVAEARKIRKRSNRKNWADYEYRNQSSTHKRRAVAYGVAYESFDKREIFERDGWICGICDDPVDRAMEYPDPMSVSLDHIIPLSKGGSHTPENVQCAHLDCNLRKGVDHDTEGRIDRFA